MPFFGRSTSSWSWRVAEEIVSLKVQFRNFIPIGKQVELKLLSREDKSVRAGALLSGSFAGLP